MNKTFPNGRWAMEPDYRFAAKRKQELQVQEEIRKARAKQVWSWCSNISFQNIDRRGAAKCENAGCGNPAVHIVEDINSYSWACARCTPLIPNGTVVWPINGIIREREI